MNSIPDAIDDITKGPFGNDNSLQRNELDVTPEVSEKMINPFLISDDGKTNL